MIRSIPFRVLVCGSRTWEAATAVHVILDGLLACYQELVVSEGCADDGADSFAHNFNRLGVIHEHYPADWEGPCRDTCRPGHRRPRGGTTYCPAAGVYRNQQMLDEGKPDLVVAFTEQPRTRGTNDMVVRAKIASVPVWVLGHG